MVKSKKWLSGVGILVASLVLTGCFSLPLKPIVEQEETPATNEVTDSAETEESVDAQPEEPEEVEEEWMLFSDPHFKYTFEVPASWTVTSEYNEQMEGLSFEVLDTESSKVLNGTTVIGGVGGTCDPDAAMITTRELDSEPILLDGVNPDPNLRFVYRLFEFSDGRDVQGGVALTADTNKSEPWCVVYQLMEFDGLHAFAESMIVSFLTSDEARSFASVADAEAFMHTDEFKTLKRVLTSLRAT